MGAQTPPWGEHRMMAEAISQAVAAALTAAAGTDVDLGNVAACDPEQMLTGRLVPVRAIVVRFGRPLRDAMIFITSLPEDVVRPLVEVGATAALGALDIPQTTDDHGYVGAFTVEEAVEYASIDLAIEQCEALYLEAAYGMELLTGELQMVLGTGLLESASCYVNGVADPFAEEPRYAMPGADGMLELGDEIGADDGPARYELGDGEMGEDEIAAMLEMGGASGAPQSGGSGIDAFDAELAQQQAEAEAAAAMAMSTASANAAAVASAPVAPELPAFDHAAATTRWTQLLSGVEVELSAELGRTDLALGDLTALDADSVLTLDQLVHEPVTVYVNGTRYATARLVVVDGEYGIEIIEVVEQAALVAPLAA